MVGYAALPRARLLRQLQKLQVDDGFDRFVEDACQAYYAPQMGALSVPPTLLPDAADWLFRRHSVRGRDCLAVVGLVVADNHPRIAALDDQIGVSTELRV